MPVNSLTTYPNAQAIALTSSGFSSSNVIELKIALLLLIEKPLTTNKLKVVEDIPKQLQEYKLTSSLVRWASEQKYLNLKYS